MADIVIELSMSPGYVLDWTPSDAIREFMQNAIDSDDFKVTYEDSVLTISNPGNLRRETILLGGTSKSNSPDKVGQFGEGYKIGLLVMCREGYKPFINIHSNFRLETWTAFIENSEAYNSDVLKISIVESSSKEFNPRVEFVIPDVPRALYDEVVLNTLQLRSEPLKTIDSRFGRILLDPNEKGRIYVNGLFLCKSKNEKIGYGYDIHPSYLKVDRDRRLLEDFKLFWVTSQMWALADKEITVKNIMDNLPDVQYLIQSNSSTSVQLIAESTHQEVKKLYGDDVVVVKNQQEFDKVVKNGSDPKDVKYVDENTYNLVTSSPSYTPPAFKYKVAISEQDPMKVLSDLYDKWSDMGVDQEVLDDMEAVLDAAAHWVLRSKQEEYDLPF